MAFFAAMMTRFYRLPLKRVSYSYGPIYRFKHKLLSEPTSSTSLADTRRTGLENIAAFFDAYPAFKYNPKGDVMQECQRLYRFLGVEQIHKGQKLERDEQEVRRRGKVRGQIMRQLRAAIVQEFNNKYGMDGRNLQSWQNLCRRVAIPVPDTLEECREAIRRTHVNLVDLAVALRDGEPVKKFATEVELAVYTQDTEKYVPRDHPLAGGLLKALLRHILDPRPERKVRGTRRPRKKSQGR